MFWKHLLHNSNYLLLYLNNNYFKKARPLVFVVMGENQSPCGLDFTVAVCCLMVISTLCFSKTSVQIQLQIVFYPHDQSNEASVHFFFLNFLTDLWVQKHHDVFRPHCAVSTVKDFNSPYTLCSHQCPKDKTIDNKKKDFWQVKGKVKSQQNASLTRRCTF